MQATENGKQNVNTLEANYGPLGPRHLLAAALAMQVKKPANQDVAKAIKTGDTKAA